MERNNFLQHSSSVFSFVQKGEIKSVSKEELQNKVDRLKLKLLSLGVKDKARIGVMCKNGIESIVAECAITQLQCITVGFPREYYNNNVAELCDKFKCSVVLCGRSEFKKVLSKNAPILNITSLEFVGEVFPVEKNIDSEDVFSVIFSSGSTGSLKGIKVSAKGLIEIIKCMSSVFPSGNHNSTILFMHFSFFQQKILMYYCLVNNINMLVVDERHTFKALSEYPFTGLMAPPLMWENFENLFNQGISARPLAKKLFNFSKNTGLIRLPFVKKLFFSELYKIFKPCCAYLWTGMAPTKESTVQFFQALGFPLINAYGLIETGPITANVRGARDPLSLGHVIPKSCEIYLDNDTSEILITQDYPLAVAYINLADMSEYPVYKGGVLHTGDLGRRNSSGNIDFIGRKDFLIVAPDGRKVSPEVIEAEFVEAIGCRWCVIEMKDDSLMLYVGLYDKALSDSELNLIVMRENRKRSHGFMVRQFAVLREPDISDDMFTRNMKINRGYFSSADIDRYTVKSE
ncbi:AMP-binding protein [Teredinibacter purpureus]|uniref:AMP-binding protein n=1 Tax=Teredinibacter purpureus TaxID=2731756 RepID=UPI0005F76AB3|nr:AMP-binding protein [Teredinibacter purpureus]